MIISITSGSIRAGGLSTLLVLLRKIAASTSTPLERPAREQVVIERQFKNIRLQSEDVAEFNYRPVKCKQDYRVVVVRKNLSVEKGEQRLFDEGRYFFYITNDRTSGAEAIVFDANDRCDQENLIEQLKNGCKALRMPVDNLVSPPRRRRTW
jgi:hypothetical protein